MNQTMRNHAPGFQMPLGNARKPLVLSVPALSASWTREGTPYTDQRAAAKSRNIHRILWDTVNRCPQLPQLFTQPLPNTPCSHLGLQKFCIFFDTVKFLRNGFSRFCLWILLLWGTSLSHCTGQPEIPRLSGIPHNMFYGHWPHDTAPDTFLFSVPPEHLFWGFPFPNPEGSVSVSLLCLP